MATRQPLLWTSKSVRRLAAELREHGHEVHFTRVAGLLRSLGFSLQANRKTLEGTQHPDRDAQFRHINERVNAAIAAAQPAISIDTKKKELVGEFANGGREWQAKGEPVAVTAHDFPGQAIGKAIPFGDLRHRLNLGLRQRRHHPRDRPVRGRLDPSLVAAPRPRALPRCWSAADHRRLRWR